MPFSASISPSAASGVPSGSSTLNLAPTSSHKRNRTQLSCTACRQSKLKCDRKKPCSQCVKKGVPLQCTFPSPAIRKKSPGSMVERVKQLENLVKDVMQSQPRILPASITPDASVGTDEDQFQRTTLLESGDQSQALPGQGQSTFVGAMHWAAILENLEEVKTFFEEPSISEDEGLKSYTSLIFNASTPTKHQDLIAALPPRLTVDQLVSRYFNSNSPGLPMIHQPAFQMEYARFWEDPEQSSKAWLALLYAILTLAAFITLHSGDGLLTSPEAAMEAIIGYRQCCVQSLLVSGYTQPGPHTIEALLIYLETQFLFGAEDPGHAYILIGTTFRIAFRMGLHRDPSKVQTSHTPFQGEMRRRVWHHLLQVDVLSSFAIGLPGNMHGIESDTQPPRHLRDEDFGPDSITLPPSRPETELTPLLYTICKSRLTAAAVQVAALVNRLTTPSYEEVQQVDSLLTHAHAAVAPFFLLDGFTIPITDTPNRTIKRFSIALLYQKCRCMLHRKQENPASRQIGLSASLSLLQYQSMIHRAASRGGPLAQDRWFLSSISMHDFLLAAMIVYMRVVEDEEGKARREMMAALERSFAVWSDTESWSSPTEARRAARIVGVMVRKVREREPEGSERARSVPDGGNGDATYSISTLSLVSNTIPPLPFQAQHDTLIKESDSTPSSGQMDLPAYDPSLGMENFDELMEFTTDFDWYAFDNQVRPQQPQQQDQAGLWSEFQEEGMAIGMDAGLDLQTEMDMGFGNGVEYGQHGTPDFVGYL